GVDPLVLPDDDENRRLVAQVHPPGWTNPTPSGRYDLVVVGAGTAGLVTAAGGPRLGARVALVQRPPLARDRPKRRRLPSKAVIASARAAANARGADVFGVHQAGVDVDFAAVMARMRRLRAAMAPTDGAPRFAGLGVDVYLGEGRFTGPRALAVDGRRLAF